MKRCRVKFKYQQNISYSRSAQKEHGIRESSLFFICERESSTRKGGSIFDATLNAKCYQATLHQLNGLIYDINRIYKSIRHILRMSKLFAGFSTTSPSSVIERNEKKGQS